MVEAKSEPSEATTRSGRDGRVRLVDQSWGGRERGLVDQNSVLYKQLMKRKARPKTFACVLSGGWYKLKEVSRNKMVRRSLPLAGVAAVFVAGLAVGYTLGKEQEINET
uniref:Uncharacterized protein n=1 Tax=Oryza barthii TaxID=65489 RepID=A0A0D3HAV4_9ORYZ